jgi:hypothetical protein
VAKYPAEATYREAEHRSAHHPDPPRSETLCLGRRSSISAEHVPDRDPHGQVSPRQLGLQSRAPPTSEEIKSSFTWYHVLLLCPEVGNKPMIPADGLLHAQMVAMLNHLIWFLESAVDEDQDEQCHYSPGASFFIQGVIALQEQIMVLGDARWEQSTEHCRVFSTNAMQLLHDLGEIFHRWIIMAPPTCVGNRGLKEYVLIRPTMTMGKVVNVRCTTSG